MIIEQFGKSLAPCIVRCYILTPRTEISIIPYPILSNPLPIAPRCYTHQKMVFICKLRQFGTQIHAITLSRRNWEDKSKGNTPTRPKDVGRLEKHWNRRTTHGGWSCKEGGKKVRTREGEVAACTLVSAALTGNWGKEGGRSQGRPVGGDCK